MGVIDSAHMHPPVVACVGYQYTVYSYSVSEITLVLDWLHVFVLYRRELQRGDSEEPARVLQELLKREKNHAQYATKMEQTGVDADMMPAEVAVINNCWPRLE